MWWQELIFLFIYINKNDNNKEIEKTGQNR